MPIDPAMLPVGPEWNIAGLDGAAMPSTGSVEGVEPAGESFGSVLGEQVQKLADMQNEASSASTALATGTAESAESVVMAVERARLSMQLASQLRTKGTEAIGEIFRTQV